MSDVAKNLPPEIREAHFWANLFDAAITLPFIRIRLGLDFFFGLIPLVGDLVMLILSLRIVYLGKALGMPSVLIRKMVVNTLVDTALGIVPVIGDIFDVFFTANLRNVKIIETWWLKQPKLDD